MPTINELPAEDLQYLANTPEFSTFISDDPELDSIEAEKFNPALELRMIAELSGIMYKIGTAIFPPIFPLLLSYLWVLDNPFITHSREKTELDADIFLYLLHSREFSGSPVDLIDTAAGFCRENGITFEQAQQEISELLAIAYNPLSFHPQTGPRSDTPPVYDADWLTNKLSAAAKIANCPAEELMFKPLSAVLWWYTQARRETEPPGTIRRRTPEEIMQSEMERLYELAIEFLTQKGKR